MKSSLALVGCGAIAQAFYVPALAERRADFKSIWLVDPNERSRAMAAAAVQGMPASQLSNVAEDLEFVIVAAPNGLHFPLAKEALLRGAHVLVEKPLTTLPEHGRQLVGLAAEHKKILAVNQTRRFFPYVGELRRRIANGDFGELQTAAHEEGEKLAWQFESGVGFQKDAQRTGVIMDLGIHVIDLYHHLLEPDWTFGSAIHDGFGGPEGLAEMTLRANSASLSIRVSRYLKQKNMGVLSFENADISFGAYDLNSCMVRKRSGDTAYIRSARPSPSYLALADRVLANFLAAGRGDESPVCDARSSLPVLQLLDEIYSGASRYAAAVGTI